MANHGAVTHGEDLLRAYLEMELVEHFATISLVMKLLGQEHMLNAVEIERLREKRQHTSKKKSPSPNAAAGSRHKDECSSAIRGFDQ